MESLADAGRLSRGRTYARAGQVLSIDIEVGRVVGIVQGSQIKPFTATVTVRALRHEERESLIEQLQATPRSVSALISGEVPEALGLLLIPRTVRDLDFDCTCPDDGWPCKHAAAVLYLVAEELDVRPATLLKLRGITFDELIDAVQSAPPSTDPAVFYGDKATFPPLPSAQPRPAISHLDSALLRQALIKSIAPRTSEAAGVHAMAESGWSTLELLYRAMVEPR